MCARWRIRNSVDGHGMYGMHLNPCEYGTMEVQWVARFNSLGCGFEFRFRFECQTISQQPEPIELNIYESRNVSREKYLRYERLCHEQPYVVASSGQPALVRVPNGTGGYIVLTDKIGRSLITRLSGSETYKRIGQHLLKYLI